MEASAILCIHLVGQYARTSSPDHDTGVFDGDSSSRTTYQKGWGSLQTTLRPLSPSDRLHGA